MAGARNRGERQHAALGLARIEGIRIGCGFGRDLAYNPHIQLTFPDCTRRRGLGHSVHGKRQQLEAESRIPLTARQRRYAFRRTFWKTTTMIRRPTSSQLRRYARCIIVQLERQPLATSLRILHLPKENLCLAVLVTLFLLCTPRVVVAQTVEQLVADACYNARQQLEHETLWSAALSVAPTACVFRRRD